MSAPADMQAIAEDIIRQYGVPAEYLAHGSDLPAVPVTIRKKPLRKVSMSGRTMWQREISVLSSVIESPSFGDVFEIDGEPWKLTTLPIEFMEIAESCGGALWNLTLIQDARPTRK